MKNLFKKLVCMTCTILLCASMVVLPAQASNDIHVQLNGQELSFDVPPQIINDRIMLPIRAVFEAMGATVTWDSSTNTATAQKDDIITSMTVGSNQFYYKSGSLRYKPHDMDTSVVNINGRVLAPMRVVANILEYCVTWDAEDKTAYIESPKTTAKGTHYNGTIIPTLSSIDGSTILCDAKIMYGTLQYTYACSNAKTSFENYSSHLIFNDGWSRDKSTPIDYGNMTHTYSKENTEIYINVNTNTNLITISVDLLNIL